MIRTMTDLCQRYGISINAMSAFVKTHREEIDPSRDHITKAGKSIFFDDFAAAKIDELRHYTPGIALADEVLREKEQKKYEKEIKDLKDEINTLKTHLLMAQERTIKAQEQVLAATAALNAATVAQIESAELKVKKEAENEILKRNIENKDREIERLRKECAAADQKQQPASPAEAWRFWRNRHRKF